MLFKFKRRNQCPYKYTLNTATGLFLRYEQCNLDVDHEGPHVSKSGQAWLNNTAMRRKIEDSVK